MRALSLILLTFTLSFLSAQTSNNNFNTRLTEMKSLFLAENYVEFANYTYSRVIELAGGKENMIKSTKQSIDQMKSQGYTIEDISFKEASDFFKMDNELQCSFRQVITMNIPEGKVKAEYTMIGISTDDGQNWTFIDSSGKDKGTMMKYFPNLHPDLPIRPKEQEFID